MTNKTDLRIIKTNNTLYEALILLLKDKTFEEITNRFNKLLNHTINFVCEHQLNSIKVLCLGDDVQGILRLSDLQLNESSVVKATVFVAKTIANFANNAGFTNFVNNYLTYTKPVGFVIYMLLIYFFSYIYTFIQIKPEELAKNLNEAGGFVPGVRPGKDTENHINKILIRLTFVGGFFIAILAAIPIVFSMIGGLESAAAIGGTSLLIVVGVALEVMQKLEAQLAMRHYKGFLGSQESTNLFSAIQFYGPNLSCDDGGKYGQIRIEVESMEADFEYIRSDSAWSTRPDGWFDYMQNVYYG